MNNGIKIGLVTSEETRLRARIAELESALRLTLAVSPDDPLLLTPAEQQVVGLTRGLKIAIGELACSGMSFDHPTITLLGRILEGKPMFPRTSCSQCGQEFGPGDHGFSHCQDHKALARSSHEPRR